MFIRGKKGFTLIELMIVVAIIGILAAIAIPNFMKFQARSRQSEARTNLKSLFTAELSYWAQYGSLGGGNVCIVGYAPERGNRYAYMIGLTGIAQGTPCPTPPAGTELGWGVDCQKYDCTLPQFNGGYPACDITAFGTAVPDGCVPLAGNIWAGTAAGLYTGASAVANGIFVATGCGDCDGDATVDTFRVQGSGIDADKTAVDGQPCQESGQNDVNN
ncbi:MAG TPA: prepilin-type N-terminal cleavage/methylation domain-containing protein [bacterium]